MEKAFRACGVSFNVWHKVDENGHATEKYEWTSMMGGEKKKVLENLPQFFKNFLPISTVDTVTKIWKVINQINASQKTNISPIST